MKVAPIPGPSLGGVQAQATPQPNARIIRMQTGNPNEEPSIPASNDTATVAPEDTQPLSPQFAALAKQRRALAVEKRAFEAQKKALQDQSATQAGGIDLARFKSDPLGVMLEHGVTYQQLTDAVLANRDGSQIQDLQNKLKAMEEGFDKKLTDRDQQSKKAALAEMQREATQLIAAGDDYELVRETRRLPDVMTLIERTYDETGEVLQVRDALKLVEDELFKDSLRLAKLKKIQAQFVPPTPEPQPQQTHRQMRTLTNRDTAQAPMNWRQRAIAAANGQPIRR